VTFLLARRVEGEAHHGLIENAFGQARLRRLPVGPLSLGALHHLLHQRLGRAFARPVLRRIHELSGGNPFFGLELARAAERETIRLDRETELPMSLEALVRDRLAALPRETQRALAVAGAAAQPTLRLVARATESDALAAVSPAVTAHVIQLDGERIRFGHPLLASGAYLAADPAERRDLHRRLGHAVAEPEERARHLALAAGGPDEEVAESLEAAAAHAALRGAPEAAAELLDRACELTPSDRPFERRRRLGDAAWFHFYTGDAQRARSAFEGLVAELPPGPERALVLTRLARVRSYGDNLRAAAALFRQAVDEGGDDAGVRALAHEGVTVCSFRLREGLIEGLQHIGPAEDFARRSGDRAMLSEALGSRLIVEAMLGLEEAGRTLERALDAGAGLEGEPIRRLPDLNVAVVRMWWDELEYAREDLERLYDRAHEARDESSLPYILLILAQVHCRLGSYERAGKAAAEVFELSVQAGQEWLESYALAMVALAGSYRGEAELVREHGGRAIELGARTGCGPAEQFGATALAHLELSLGNPDAALEHVEPLFAWARRETADEPGATPGLAEGLEALVEAGRLDEAELQLAGFVKNARRLDRASALGAGARSRGLIAARRGDGSAAIKAFEEALVALDRVPMPLERARTLLALGAALRRGKRKREAREALNEAAGEFDRIGARIWAERARVELGQIGGRAPSRGELTPSERRVAELVAQGRTNREVAGALFVSERTVEGHLSHVYAKLGVRSRAELARRFQA
jgi:DNA-binding CsgD family transcriptional regulator